MCVNEDVVEKAKLERCAGHVPVNQARMWLQRGANLAKYFLMLRSAGKSDTQDISAGTSRAERRAPSSQRKQEWKDGCEEHHKLSRKLP